jgi:hypothetical protein
MGNIRSPRFITGIIALVLHVFAIAFQTGRNHELADIFMIGGFALMFICWIWGIIDVATTDTLQGSQRKFWLIAVIAIPFVGSMFYSVMHSKRNTIVD